jgi:hypothetical protein
VLILRKTREEELQLSATKCFYWHKDSFAHKEVCLLHGVTPVGKRRFTVDRGVSYYRKTSLVFVA